MFSEYHAKNIPKKCLTTGDIFVLRNAGNTCTHAEGSMVGSLEFCTGKLGSRLILVLGHTKCGAIYGATKTYLDAEPGKKAERFWSVSFLTKQQPTEVTMVF